MNNPSSHENLQVDNSWKVNWVLIGMVLAVLMMVFVFASVPNWVGDNINYTTSEDTVYYHNLSANITGFSNDVNFTNYSYTNYANIIEVSIIFLTLLLSNLITSYYFLKVIHYEKKNFIVFLSCAIYTLVFFITFMNLAMMI